MRILALLLIALQLAGGLAAADFKGKEALLKPAPTDARSAVVTARMLERAHYSQQEFNDKMSSKFLDRY
ncbi:MAG TPA: hypothetical protein VK968_18330, partial [Roseimicrobium sp.]|nr:hypothetical protein [Roseimicrobium sp.]